MTMRREAMMQRGVGLLLAFGLAACGGGGSGSSSLPGTSPIGGGGTPHAQKVSLRMVIRGPHRKTNVARRGMRPRFVSPSTDGVLVQAYPHGAAQTPANLIASSATDVSSGSAACGGQTGYPRTCSVSIGVPATTGVNDDFVFTSYDSAPSGGTFPTTAHVLGIGSVLNQAIVANTNNVLTIYLGGVIAGLNPQAGFASLPADGSAHSLSFVIDPTDYGNNPITAGSNDPYANPIVVSVTETGGSGHATLSLDGGAGASSVTLTKSTDTVALNYDGGGSAGYGASVTIAAPSVGGTGGASETVQVSPLFVSATTFTSSTRTLNLSPSLAATVTLSELNASGAATVYSATPSGCTNIASVASPSGTRASATLGITGGSTVSASGCSIAFSDGTSTVSASVTNSSGNGSVGVPPAVSITEWQTPTGASKPVGITSGSDGALWFTENGVGQIGRIPTNAPTPNPSSTATPNPDISEYPTPTIGSQPAGITAGPDGALWFTECGAAKIGRIPTDATPGSSAQITEYADSAGSYPYGIATGPDGNLWFGDCDSNVVAAMSPAGSLLRTFTTTQSYIFSVVTGPDGAVWFTECQNPGEIGQIKDGVLQEEAVPTTLGPYPNPFGIAVGSDGNIWFTDFSNEAIGKVDVATFPNSGSITEFPVLSGGNPQEITGGPDGALWFADSGNNAIGRIPTDATVADPHIAEYALPTTGAKPQGITKGPDGNLWFTEYGVGKIGRLVIGSAPNAEHAITHFPHVKPGSRRLPRSLRRHHPPFANAAMP